MCSNNQSGNPSRENTLHYNRDELAREILDVYLSSMPRLGDALYSNLEHIIELCESIQQVCLASLSVDEISINTNDLYGLLAVIVNEIKVARLLGERLSSLEAKYNSDTHLYKKTQQELNNAKGLITDYQQRIKDLESMFVSSCENKAGES